MSSKRGGREPPGSGRRSKDAIADYLATLPEIRRSRGASIHRLVRKLFPVAVVSLEYRMPTYRVRESFFAWANQKRYLSVYTCAADRIDAFKAAHRDIPTGTACINFRDGDSLPLQDLAEVIRSALSPPPESARRGRNAVPD